MNPKIFVGVAVVAMVAIIASILVVGPTMMIVDDSSPFGTDRSLSTAEQIIPLQVSLNDIQLERISDRSATLEVSFVLYNPNPRSMIVQTLDYRLFEHKYHDDDEGALGGGQIGSRPEGMVEFSSNYYTLLSDSSIILRDTVRLSNTGSSEFWSALEAGDVSWRVAGDVFYNLSSMTSGQENRLTFDITP